MAGAPAERAGGDRIMTGTTEQAERHRHHPDSGPPGIYADAAGIPWQLTGSGRWLRFGEEDTFPKDAPRLPLRKMVRQGYLFPRPTRAQIREVLLRGAREGLGVDETAARICKLFEVDDD